MAEFNPSMQIQYCRDIDRVFFGKAPQISAMIDAYGRNAAESWLEIQLNDLSEFAGCREKLSIRQIKDTAAMIVETYPHYNLTEFMLFFQRFKRCRYGRFYGAVDPMIILQSLDMFDDERRQAYNERQREENHRKQAETEREMQAVKQRYIDRVPDAFTDKAPMNYLQYRLMGYDAMPDGELNREIAEIRTGRKVLPKNVTDMLKILDK